MENKKINKADFLKEITDKTAEKAKALGFADEDIDLAKKIVDALAVKFEKNVTVDKVTEIVNDVATELGISKTAVKGVVISTIIDSLVAFCGLPVDPAKKEDKPAEEPKADDGQGKKPEEPAAEGTVTESIDFDDLDLGLDMDTETVAKDIKKIVMDKVNQDIADRTIKEKNKQTAINTVNICIEKVKKNSGKKTDARSFANRLSLMFHSVGLHDLGSFIDMNNSEVQELVKKYKAKNKIEKYKKAIEEYEKSQSKDADSESKDAE